jgi:hypothetical protein
MGTGNLMGVGVGEASSNEEKYKWRKPVCNEEYDETPEDRRREKWFHGKDGKPNYKAKQIRTNPSDVANTILKMAKKRAQIDMTLTATAASDVFDQDLEDLPEGLDLGHNGKTTLKEPQKKEPEQAESSKISEAQRKRFYAIAKGAGKTDDEILAYVVEMGFPHTTDITKDKYEEVVKWAETKQEA